MKIILASSNSHKAKEFSNLFDKDVLTIIPALEKIDVEETGVTYNENALLKAKAYYDKYQSPTMADDSGLNIPSLPGELGVYSARFGGEDLGYREKAELLFEKLKDRSQSDRNAYFTCVLCFYLNPNEIYFFEGRMEGEIGKEYKGEQGFGYDPIFIPRHHTGDATLAMISEWKAENSHRSKACLQAEKFLQERVGQN